jgi:DNA-binding CsgD family transcriptional regulator
MSDLNDLVKRHTIKHGSRIKKICEPLDNLLHIPTFEYYFINDEGHFGIFTTEIEQTEFFFSKNLFQNCSSLKHPRFFRSGYSLIQAIENPYYLEISKKKYNIESLFQILQCSGSTVEGFLFSFEGQHKASNLLEYVHNLDLLLKFCNHFKREAHSLIEEMQKDQYSLLKAKGKAFFNEAPLHPLNNNDPKALKFLKTLAPLTPREQECLDLYKLGHSSQATAAKLGLSQRTVECYFENMKNKLGVNTKRELLLF